MRPTRPPPAARGRFGGIRLERHTGTPHPKRARAEQLLQEGKTVKAVQQKLKIPYATVYGWSRKLPPRPALNGTKAIAPPAGKTRRGRRKSTAAEGRTEPTITSPSSGPRSVEEIRADRERRDAAAIDEVRLEIDRQDRQRAAQKSQDKDPPRRLEPGAKPGTGRKVCPKCHILNPSSAKVCGDCGTSFHPAGTGRS